MVAMNFPDNPTNGDIKSLNGITYTYDSDNTLWKVSSYPNAPKGDGGTITVGTVTTLDSDQSATVVNVGDSADAIFDFGIPRGVAGLDTAKDATLATAVDSDWVVFQDKSDGNTVRKDTISNVLALGGGGFASLQAFTASGTWTRPTGVVRVMIIATGGGGGGGGTSDANKCGNGGGGSGATAIQTLDVSSAASSTITIGAGGAGSTNGTGTAGGTTTWADGVNTNVTAGGGTGGGKTSSLDTSGEPGLGSSTTTGQLLAITGGDANPGLYGTDDGSLPATGGAGGNGGASFWGGGGHGGKVSQSADTGGTGSGYGSGGGGGNGDAGNGAAGADGVIFVMEFK